MPLYFLVHLKIKKRIEKSQIDDFMICRSTIIFHQKESLTFTHPDLSHISLQY